MSKQGSTTKEMLQVSLQLVDPDFKPSTAKNSLIQVTEDTNEHVNAMISWAPTDGKDHYQWFVLALENNDPEPNDPDVGRVVAVNAKSLTRGATAANIKIIWRSSKSPVTALCAYKMSSILIAAGNEIILQHLDFATKRWRTLSRYHLPSPATTISCQGSTIIVATTHHSFLVLVEKRDELTLCKSDAVARNTAHALMFGGNRALFTSHDDKGTNLIGLTDFHKTDNVPPSIIFQASLPLLIDRIELDPHCHQDNRNRFHASTKDGTLYQFSTLTRREWKLLRFLQDLNHLENEKTAKRKPIKPIPMALEDDEGNYIGDYPLPLATVGAEMHINGDRLAMMLDDNDAEGPYALLNVLEGRENVQRLRVLVRDVLGDKAAVWPIENTIVWVRGLLRFPGSL
jgi:hypothetical protein